MLSPARFPTLFARTECALPRVARIAGIVRGTVRLASSTEVGDCVRMWGSEEMILDRFTLILLIREYNCIGWVDNQSR